MTAVVHRFQAMASACTIHLETETGSGAIALAAEAEVRRIEARYSRYREDSELTQINRAAAAGIPVAVDTETAGLIAFAQGCHRASAGAFDITSGVLRRAWNFALARLPDAGAVAALLPLIGLDKVTLSEGRLCFAQPGLELDLGGLGKEYACDRAAEVCLEMGASGGFVDLGGDIRVIGPQARGIPWRFGIRHPRDAAAAVAELALADGALATSGNYERFIDVDGVRYCHILDPRSGWPAQGLSSVTVVAPRCLVAGSLATMAMLRGRDGIAWLQGLGFRHVVVDDEGRCSGTEPLLA
jgi:FAD:protein FMN transferase